MASLTDREREVLTRLARGQHYGQLAAEMFMATSTAKIAARKAASKLGARNRTHAVANAIRQGHL